jgi:anti-sigma factor RsiW
MAELDENDRETLTAYLDGELDDAQTEALETRLGQDAKLRAELETMQKTWGMLDFLPKAELSPDFTNRTIDRLTLAGQSTQLAGRPSTFRRVATWTMACLLAAVVGVGGAAAVRRYAVKPIDPNESLVPDLRLLERLRAYEKIDDLDELRALDQPDFFGEESAS